MKRAFFSKKGQSILEYAVLISVIAVALSAAGIYGKRAITGNLKSTSDDIGQQYDMEKGSAYTETVNFNNSTETRGGGDVVNEITSQKRTRKTVVKTPKIGTEAAVTTTVTDLPAFGWKAAE